MNNTMKTIILGIGNPILGDDGVGIHVVRQVKKHVKNQSHIVIDEAMTGGMNLLDLIIGFDKAILIDTVHLKNEVVGNVKKFSIKDLKTVHSCNPHDVSLCESLQLAEALGETQIPKDIIIVGIILHKIPVEFSETLSPRVASAIPKAVEIVLSEIDQESE